MVKQKSILLYFPSYFCKEYIYLTGLGPATLDIFTMQPAIDKKARVEP